jgi:thioredoxin 1
MEIPFVGDPRWEERVLDADRPVMVEFWSPTCTVCRTMDPRFEGLIEDYQERVSFFRVNVDEEEDLVWAYEVMSTPTFIVYVGGEPMASMAGERDRTELANLLEDALTGA